MAPLVAPSSWKSLATLHSVKSLSVYNREIERYLRPDIVLTRNGRWRGGASVVPGEVHSSTNTFAIFFYRKLPDRSGKLLHYLCSSLWLSRWNSLQCSFPGLPHPRKGPSLRKTSQRKTLFQNSCYGTNDIMLYCRYDIRANFPTFVWGGPPGGLYQRSRFSAWIEILVTDEVRNTVKGTTLPLRRTLCMYVR